MSGARLAQREHRAGRTGHHRTYSAIPYTTSTFPRGPLAKVVIGSTNMVATWIIEPNS
jgi:hypothetical protein